MFGVSGKGSIREGSGAEILKQLNAIAKNISNQAPPKITFLVNKENTRQQIQNQLNSISKSLKITIGASNGTGSITKNATQQIVDLEKRLQSAYNRFSAGGFGGKADLRKLGNLDEGQLKAYLSSIQNVQNAMSGMTVKNGVIDFGQTTAEQMQQAMDAINQFLNIDRKLAEAQQRDHGALEKHTLIYDKLINRITQYQKINAATLNNTPWLANDLENLKQQLENGTFQGTESLANSTFLKITNRIREAGGEVENLGQKVTRTFKEKLGYGIIATAAMAARQSVRQVYDNVVNLDSAVVDLQIATGYTRKETQELLNTYSELGRELGATTSDVAQAADTWLRQGYNIEDTNELIKQSTMLSKLGQMSSTDASTALTSSLKGYQLAAEDASKVVDRLTAVDMEAAASAGDIATAMAECANSARIAGVDMDTLIGYLTVVKEVTQDGSESVGNFAKTMFARMGNIKAGFLEDPTTGENISDVETVLSGLGIKLRSANDQFRDFDDVLSETASKWDSYSNVQQHAIAVAFAGTRQQEKFLVLMESFNNAMGYAGVSTNSAGTALDKYTNSYLPSVQAAQDSFNASFEQFSQTVLDGGSVAGIIRIGDGLMQGATALSKWNLLLPAVLAGIMSIKNVGKLNSRNMPSYAKLQLIA